MTNRETKQSVFQRWLLNNKIISSMLIILLLLAIIYMFDKVNFIFEPIVALFSAVGAPIIIAGVFYYLLNPIVDWAERRYKMSRVATITVQFLVLLVLIVWGLAVFIPWLSDQIVGLINHWPEYWRALVKMIDHEKLNATDLYAMLPKRRARFLAPRAAGDSMMAAILIKQALPIAVQDRVQILTATGLHELTHDLYVAADKARTQHENDLMMTLTLVIASPIIFMLLDYFVFPNMGISGVWSVMFTVGLMALMLGVWYAVTFSTAAADVEHWVMTCFAKLHRTNEN